MGSTGRIATDIHSLLTQKNHQSTIAYGRYEAKDCESTYKIGNKFDNYAHVMKTRIFDQHGFGSKKATQEFVNNIKLMNPDIIHLHNLHGYYINIEVLFKYLKEANKPIIWTLHDCWAFTGHCVHFEYTECKCWEEGSGNRCIQKRDYPSSWFLNNSRDNFLKKRKLFTEIDKMIIVTPSEWLGGIVKKSFLKNYPVKVINNGIDLDKFSTKIQEKKIDKVFKGKYVILGVANVWSSKKGLHFFEGLAKKLNKDEIIMLVGLTSSQIKRLPPNIVGVTKTSSIEELAILYNFADVFVNPTLEDNFPTTHLEALACGTPVITFDTGGCKESLNEHCGIVLKNKDVESLRHAIDNLRANNLKQEDCVDRAKDFDKMDKFTEYISLYEEVLYE